MSIEHGKIRRVVGSTYTQLFTTIERGNGATYKDLEITVYHADRSMGRKTAEINASSFNGSADKALVYIALYQAAVAEADRLNAEGK